MKKEIMNWCEDHESLCESVKDFTLGGVISLFGFCIGMRTKRKIMLEATVNLYKDGFLKWADPSTGEIIPAEECVELVKAFYKK